ncbi:MAG: rare lipoprotein [Verrucomicrobiales bacterium]|nr:rare lipoprotein [Verrucomicrobiales bacterium]
MAWRTGLIALVALVAVIAACATVVFFTIPAHGGEMCGRASYYGAESGNRTANGEHFTGRGMTAAHRSMPFGTKLRVTYRGRSVVVRINDRGPYIKGRFLDLSRAAAAKLGMIPAGVARVCVERL